MLQQIDSVIRELPHASVTVAGATFDCLNTAVPLSNAGYWPQDGTGYWPPQQTIYWNTWPVYVCTDKTKKAIQVLKALQADKLIKCDSVPKFIALVEKISSIL